MLYAPPFFVIYAALSNNSICRFLLFLFFRVLAISNPAICGVAIVLKVPLTNKPCLLPYYFLLVLVQVPPGSLIN
jgi:hypothetical protein